MNDFFNLLRYTTLAGYQWQQPRLLLLIAAVPLLFGLRWVLARRRAQVAVAFAPGPVRRDWSAALRFVPDVVLGLALSFAIVALARPQRTDERVEQSGRGIDLVLALDVSGSMEIQDLRPNRLEAAKRLATDFVSSRVGDRLALVAFAGEAYSLAPLTTDYDLLREDLAGLRVGMIKEDGTAIGTALGVATNRLRESTAKSRVCILLSDGENNAGSLDPQLAAQLAHAFGIRIYTIGLGKDGFVPYGQDSLGRTRYVNTRLDETTMRQLAAAADGRFFRATDTGALREVFAQINRLEKSEIKQLRFRNTKDFYRPYLWLSIGLWLLWLLLKNTFLSNPLED
ncbi:VWA domain-containing protein [Hymenobacter negativus]|uniref:VWA domain-containing protein n=1 Tax=Hymenobacter negativus TaxID=2795026 RepID=A0ABS0Q1J6_9BACT|nr:MULTISPECIES: VWA domain-containing protein [Bacteria]MBH8556536.1 VWA domain-containing protein [Hymenobacter negativus]MBH8571057.1 VWA domain-containing protein [Hymenobacter negativus]MBR7210794.1 VWA domain-containing protein [Microvirga sp. STS02]